MKTKLALLHDWALSKIKRLYSPVGNEGWLTVHLWSVINQAFRLGEKSKKEHAIEFKNWCEGNYAIKLGQLVPATDDWTTEEWYNEFNQQTKP